MEKKKSGAVQDTHLVTSHAMVPAAPVVARPAFVAWMVVLCFMM